MQLGRHIHVIRQSKGYKQAYLAEVAGVSQGQISRIERGVAKPSFTEMVRIAAALHCSLDEFADDVRGPLHRRS